MTPTTVNSQTPALISCSNILLPVLHTFRVSLVRRYVTLTGWKRPRLRQVSRLPHDASVSIGSSYSAYRVPQNAKVLYAFWKGVCLAAVVHMA